MGYTQLPDGLSALSKAVISLWFKIPQSTFDIMAGISDTPPLGFGYDHMCDVCYSPPLFKIIPLMTFGSGGMDSSDRPYAPSFIGVDCAYGVRTLCCNLQTPVNGSQDIIIGSPYDNRPGAFYMAGYHYVDGLPPPGYATVVQPDVWQHALVSFDISGAQSATYHNQGASVFTSSSVFNWALNDVAKTGSSLDPSGGGRWAPFGLADNQIITQWLVDNIGFEGETASFSSGTTETGAAGVPVAASMADFNQHVFLAHWQVYVDEYLDFGSQVNRRLFIDDNGEPTDPSIAADFFGHDPEISFHAATDWRSGTNVGTAGEFTPVGTILKAGGNPKLGA